MKTYIAKLKSKPEPVKKQIALWATIIIGGIIFLFWIETFSFASSPDAVKNQENIVKPLTVLKDTVQNGYTQISNGVQNPFAQNSKPDIIPEPAPTDDTATIDTTN